MTMREKTAKAMVIAYTNEVLDPMSQFTALILVDAALDALADPSPEFIDAIAGYFMTPRARLPSVWAALIRAEKEGR